MVFKSKIGCFSTIVCYDGKNLKVEVQFGKRKIGKRNLYLNSFLLKNQFANNIADKYFDSDS